MKSVFEKIKIVKLASDLLKLSEQGATLGLPQNSTASGVFANNVEVQGNIQDPNEVVKLSLQGGNDPIFNQELTPEQMSLFSVCKFSPDDFKNNILNTLKSLNFDPNKNYTPEQINDIVQKINKGLASQYDLIKPYINQEIFS